MPDFDAFQVFTLGAALGIAAGLRLGYAVGWLLSRPLPRPWRAYARLWRDTWRYVADFAERWDAQNGAKPGSGSSHGRLPSSASGL